MGLGYTGRVELNGGMVYATSASLSVLHDIIESGGAYGGKLYVPGLATGSAHLYDPWKTQSHVSFDVTESIANAFTEQLTESRGDTYTISLDAGGGSTVVETAQYWTGMGISASVGSLVTGSMEGVYFEKTDLSSLGIDEPADLTEIDCGDDLLPYWKTGVGDGCCNGWSLNASQSVTPIYCCIEAGQDDERSPDYVVLGQVMVNLTVSSISEAPGDDTITITLGGASISLSGCEVQEKTQNISGGTSFNTLDITYRAFLN